MTYKPVSIPSLPVDTSPALRQFLSSVKEALEVRLNQRGSALDASPTFQDLLDTGILKVRDSVTVIGGKQYTAEQLLGVVQANLPTWITSETAPPAPTGLDVGTDAISGTKLTWTLSAFDQYSHTEIWRSTENNLDTKVLIGSTSGSTFTTDLPPPNVVYYYWIRDVANNLLASPFNSVSGTPTTLGPSATAPSHSFVGPDVDLTWPSPTSNVTVALYRVEFFLGGTWQTLDVVSGNSHRFKVTWSGIRQFRIIAIDVRGNESVPTQFSIEVDAPSTPSVSHDFNGEHVVFKWTATSTGSLPVDYFEVYADSVAPENLLSEQYANVYRTKITKAIWGIPVRTFYIRSIDTAGAASIAAPHQVTVAPPQVIDLSTQVIDNNVLFRWDNTPGSLPIASYELRRGDVWNTAEVIGKKDGGFTTVFESPQGSTIFTYWLAAIDTAGFYGPEKSATAKVDQPPDYFLAENFESSFTGTKTNAFVNLVGDLILPVSTTQTWSSHFSSRSWASPEDQINAGYPVFIQPGTTSASYVEDFDYGTVLAAMKISVSYLSTPVSVGATPPTVSFTLTTALDAAFTSNVQIHPVTADAIFATNFRYIRMTMDVTSTDDKNVLAITNLNVKLDTKLKSATGRITANASDTTGTTVYLTDTKTALGNPIFVDVESIVVSVNGTSAANKYIAIYDYQDVPTPTYFKVYVFDSNGVQKTAEVGYSVRGF